MSIISLITLSHTPKPISVLVKNTQNVLAWKQLEEVSWKFVSVFYFTKVKWKKFEFSAKKVAPFYL